METEVSDNGIFVLMSVAWKLVITIRYLAVTSVPTYGYRWIFFTCSLELKIVGATGFREQERRVISSAYREKTLKIIFYFVK